MRSTEPGTLPKNHPLRCQRALSTTQESLQAPPEEILPQLPHTGMISCWYNLPLKKMVLQAQFDLSDEQPCPGSHENKSSSFHAGNFKRVSDVCQESQTKTRY